jgi:hypothetical protein
MRQRKNGGRILSFLLVGLLVLFMLPIGLPTASAAGITVNVLAEPFLEYDEVYEFRDGRAAVVRDNKYGFIDKTGQEVIPVQYQWYEYHAGLTMYFREGLVDVHDEAIGGEKFIDVMGNTVIPAQDSVWTESVFSNGYARMYAYSEDTGEYDGYYIDKTGRRVVPPEDPRDLLDLTPYDEVYGFSEGLMAVRQGEKYGFIDMSGRLVIPVSFDCAYYDYSGNWWSGSFVEGRAAVIKNSKYGFMDNSGTVVIPYAYDYAYDFQDGLAIVVNNGKYGYIDPNGRVVAPLEYDWIESFSEGLSVVAKEGKDGFIDPTGRVVIPLEYDSSQPFSEGLAAVSKGGKFGYIDKTGRVAVPLIYDTTYTFSGGVAAVQLNGKWGYVDSAGNVVVPPIYDYAYEVSEGLAFVQLNGKYGILEFSGGAGQPLSGDSNITLDYAQTASFTTPQDYTDYLRDAIRDMNGAAPTDLAVRDIGTYIQTAVGDLSTGSVMASDNQAKITGGVIAAGLNAAKAAYDGLMKLLTDNGIVLNRAIPITVRVECQGLDLGQTARLIFDKTLPDTLGGNDATFILNDSQHAIGVTGADLRQLTDAFETLAVQIVRTGEGVYDLVFIDGSGNAVSQLPAPVSVTLPAKGAYDTVFASHEGAYDNWGGQYDELGGTIGFSTPYSGTYEIRENLSEIPDIVEFPQEMRDAIQFMVSKGFFELKDDLFDPTGKLSRYEFSSALVRMFYALDRNLQTSFVDVPEASIFYPYIASGEHEAIIEGIGDNLFAGERLMKRQEAVTVAARTLKNQKGYDYPADPMLYLSTYADVGSMRAWAYDPVSLAARERLIGLGDNFRPLSDITRAEAATILYRLFMLLYETPPVAIDMTPIAEVAASEPEETVPASRDRSDEDEEEEPDEEGSPIPVLPLALGVTGVLVLGGGGLALFLNRGKLFAPKP